MIRKPISFYSGAGLLLKGTLTYPDDPGDGSRFPAVVLCNGYMGGKDIYMPQAGEILASQGFASLAFDYRGFGESEGPHWRLIPEEQLDDIRNAISFTIADPAINGSRLALWGTSLGGSHVLSVAATDHRVCCVIANTPLGSLARQARFLRTDSAWRDFQEQLEIDRRERVLTGRSRYVHPLEVMPYDDSSRRAFEASLEIYPERRSMRYPLETADRFLDYVPESRVELIAPRPLLVISAEKDLLAPPGEQRSIFERAGEPKRLVVIAGANHFDMYSPERFRELMAASVAFLEEYVG